MSKKLKLFVFTISCLLIAIIGIAIFWNRPLSFFDVVGVSNDRDYSILSLIKTTVESSDSMHDLKLSSNDIDMSELSDEALSQLSRIIEEGKYKRTLNTDFFSKYGQMLLHLQFEGLNSDVLYHVSLDGQVGINFLDAGRHVNMRIDEQSIALLRDLIGSIK